NLARNGVADKPEAPWAWAGMKQARLASANSMLATATLKTDVFFMGAPCTHGGKRLARVAGEAPGLATAPRWPPSQPTRPAQLGDRRGNWSAPWPPRPRG